MFCPKARVLPCNVTTMMTSLLCDASTLCLGAVFPPASQLAGGWEEPPKIGRFLFPSWILASLNKLKARKQLETIWKYGCCCKKSFRLLKSPSDLWNYTAVKCQIRDIICFNSDYLQRFLKHKSTKGIKLDSSQITKLYNKYLLNGTIAF